MNDWHPVIDKLGDLLYAVQDTLTYYGKLHEENWAIKQLRTAYDEFATMNNREDAQQAPLAERKEGAVQSPSPIVNTLSTAAAHSADR